MPWHRDFNHLKHVTIGLWISAIILMVCMFSVFRFSQVKTLNKLTAVESELKINTQSHRNSVKITQDDIKQLKEEMKNTNARLDEAQDKLLKLNVQP